MIDLAKLKELVALMAENDLSEVSIKAGDDSVSIRRGPGGTTVNHQPVIYQGAAAPPAGASPAPAAPQAPLPANPAHNAQATPPPGASPSIDSPMVGTFYASPNPDAPPFVKPGQAVTAESVVCIIEAMKVFNEIKAEKAGVVEAMLVKNGQAVEFGQRLFALRA